MRYFVLMLAFIAISGCAVRFSSPVSTMVEQSFPTIGQQHRVSVGDRMIVQGVAETFPAIRVTSKTDIKGDIELHPGIYKIFIESEKHIYAVPFYEGAAITSRSGGAEQYQILRISKKDRTACAVGNVAIGRVTWCTDSPLRHEVTTATGESERNFQQTLIYNGRTGNFISLGYREFSGSLARPAFSNDASYDLSQSDTVGYRGATINIIDANNEFIEYKLMSGFR